MKKELTKVNAFNEKIKVLIDSIENEHLTVEATEAKIKELFDDAVIHEESIIETGFTQYKEQTYLKNSNGAYFEKVTGPGDYYGNMVSHEGTDLSFVNMATDKRYNLFFQAELQEDGFMELKKDISEIGKSLSQSRMLEIFENTDNASLILETFEDDSIKNNHQYVKRVVENLWDKAESKYAEEMDYYDYSPEAAGFDFEPPRPSTETFHSMLMDYKDNPAILREGYRFMGENKQLINFVKENIIELEKEIFYVENKDIYMRVNELESSKGYIESVALNSDNQFDFKTKKENIKAEYAQLANETKQLFKLESTKQTFAGFLQRSKLNEEIKKCSNSIKQLEGEIAENEDKLSQYMKLFNEKPAYEKQMGDLINKLPLPKYDIDAHYEDCYKFPKRMQSYQTNYESRKKQLECFKEILNHSPYQEEISAEIKESLKKSEYKEMNNSPKEKKMEKEKGDPEECLVEQENIETMEVNTISL